MRGWVVARISAVVLLSLSVVGYAADYSKQQAALQAALPDLAIKKVSESPIPGLLQVTVGADIYYASADGRYFVQAEIFDLEQRMNITETSRSDARSAYTDIIKGQSAVEFAADDAKYVVTVFTDIDCGYCRKLHQQMSEYNKRGISIRYLFFPRSGPQTDSWFKADSVWCSKSQQQAMTQAKSGITLPKAKCSPTPVANHYELVNELGLSGTPALFTENGQLLVGYRTPEELLSILEAE